MSELETAAEKNEEKVDGWDHEHAMETSRDLLQNLLRRFVLFISFGPGVLGFLWLIGRILRR